MFIHDDENEVFAGIGYEHGTPIEVTFHLSYEYQLWGTL